MVLLEAVQPPPSWLRQFTDEHGAMRALIVAIGQQLIEEHAAKPIRFADLTTSRPTDPEETVEHHP